jgi:IS30 family transposase
MLSLKKKRRYSLTATHEGWCEGRCIERPKRNKKEKSSRKVRMLECMFTKSRYNCCKNPDMWKRVWTVWTVDIVLCRSAGRSDIIYLESLEIRGGESPMSVKQRIAQVSRGHLWWKITWDNGNEIAERDAVRIDIRAETWLNGSETRTIDIQWLKGWEAFRT